MRLTRETIEVKANISEFDTVRKHVEERLAKAGVSDGLIYENILVLEEVFVRLVNHINDKNKVISIATYKRLSEVLINIEYDGARFALDFNSEDENDPGAAIINKFEDKISWEYQRKHNFITIQVESVSDSMFMRCILGVLLAVLVFLAMAALLSEEQRHVLLFDYVYKIEKMFGNAMFMISAPLTYLSLVCNLTDIRMYSTYKKGMAGLFAKVIGTSAITLFLSGIYYFLTICVITLNTDGYRIYYAGTPELENSVMNILDMVPEDLIGAFTDISPLPLLFIAIVSAAALTTMNKNFETMKEVNDAFYSFLCKFLEIIMMFLPIAVFFATLDLLLTEGMHGLKYQLIFILISYAGIAIMMLYYVLRLVKHGIKPFAFVRDTFPAMKENFKINSTINSIPYNERFLSKTFKIKIKLLDDEMPVFSKINLEGNCFILFFSGLTIQHAVGRNMTVPQILLMAVLVLVLSLGAPNHAGSILIGLLIIFSYIGVPSVNISIPILCEAILGKSITMINTFGNYVTVAIDAKNNGCFVQKDKAPANK
ncbi:MAG: cation:dicarboxylase symporter family transporter [Clostridiales bacterium]|nr:cation:dicarboxylase symporter family transporter [Candidatus Crickella caballi]